jgi:hypothetical protein
MHVNTLQVQGDNVRCTCHNACRLEGRQLTVSGPPCHKPL